MTGIPNLPYIFQAARIAGNQSLNLPSKGLPNVGGMQSPGLALKTAGVAKSPGTPGTTGIGQDEILSLLLGAATASNPYTAALSFLPGVMQMASGLFGKNETSPSTQVDQSSVHMMETNFNESPALLSNQTAFDTYNKNVSQTKANPVAAYGHGLSAKIAGNNNIIGQAQNMETQMKNDKAQHKGRLDMFQSSLDENRRREYDAVEGMLGVDGTIANTGYQSLGNAAIMNNRANKQTAADMFSMYAGSKAIAGKSGIMDRNYDGFINFMQQMTDTYNSSSR